ncbi:trans-sialidase, partial [Trypanosoma conorhini]
GSRGSVYVDGKLVGSSDALPTPEARIFEISYFYFGDEDVGNDRGGSVTVTNVFLYNRPLSATEPDKDDGNGGNPNKGDSSMRVDVPRVLLLLLLLGLWGIAALS